MDKVKKKIEQLTEDLDYLLYYDPEEIRKESAREETMKEVALAMLKENLTIDVIIKVTGLSKKEIEELKED